MLLVNPLHMTPTPLQGSISLAKGRRRPLGPAVRLQNRIPMLSIG